jgi:AraC-like DNA-binding protein
LGKIATNILAAGDGWSVGDVVCTAGPQDRPFEEQHQSVSIAVVLEGSFRYRSSRGSEVMSPGSLLLDNYGQCFECGHEHGTGDHCVSFEYTPEFFERAGATGEFPVNRIPPVPEVAPWVVEARLAVDAPAKIVFEELAHGLAAAVLDVVGQCGSKSCAPLAGDERRISATLRFIEAHLSEPLPLELLAATAKMSKFHFLRVFKQINRVTPHQYILRARLREAASRLKTRADSVLDIALDAGFRDLSNFNHAFREEFGVSPVRFRGERLQARRLDR